MIRIPLKGGKVAIVDDEDRHLAAFTWCAIEAPDTTYAGRWTRNDEGPKRFIYLHREIVGATDNAMVDHEDSDGLNCRRKNVRVATSAQNQGNRPRHDPRNRSGFKGVSWMIAARKWRASIGVRRKTIHLGLFPSAEEAARAYDDAARLHFREFACLNFPRPGERGMRRAP